MFDGKNGWLTGSFAGSRPRRESRRPMAMTPGGAETGLEDRRLMSLQVATFEVPAVALTGQDVTKGPDGNLWFTEPGVGKVGKMTPSGVVTEYPLTPGNSASGGITAGPDGNVWFTETNQVGRVTPAGVVTDFPVAPGARLTGITSGPDGNVWFMDTKNQKIGLVTPAGVVNEFSIPPATTLTSNGGVNLFHDITAGPDGNIWYTAESYNHRTGTETGEIGRVTPDGTVSVFMLPAGKPAHRARWGGSKLVPTGGMLADAITAGPDGNVWFTEHQANGVSGVGRITTTGKISQFTIPTTPKGNSVPNIATSITSGPDGNLWFNLASDNFQEGPNPTAYLGRITTAGKTTIYTVPASKDTQAALVAEGAESITAGPDGNLWFTGVSRRFVSQTGRVLGAFAPPKH